MAGVMLIVGCGFSGKALARLLLAEGWRVIGTTRGAASAQALAAMGVEPLVWPGADLGAALAQADHLLLSVAPGPEGDPALPALAPALRARPARLAWAGYLSTTGVYGDHGGGWVDEATPPAPATARGRARVAAEAAWAALAAETALPLHVFRLAGIYGPGRGPFAKIRAGTARRVVKANQVFSRIHVDDIAAVLRASIVRPDPGAVYNVCDDDPAPPQDVIAHAAALLGMDAPPEVAFEDAGLTGMAASFYAESKRVRNDRIKAELGVTLRWPDYRSGLAAVLAAEANPPA